METNSLKNEASLSIHVSMVNLVLPYVGSFIYFRDFQKFVGKAHGIKSRKIGMIVILIVGISFSLCSNNQIACIFIISIIDYHLFLQGSFRKGYHETIIFATCKPVVKKQKPINYTPCPKVLAIR